MHLVLTFIHAVTHGALLWLEEELKLLMNKDLHAQASDNAVIYLDFVENSGWFHLTLISRTLFLLQWTTTKPREVKNMCRYTQSMTASFSSHRPCFEHTCINGKALKGLTSRNLE
jgi:hypothetical protein